MDLHAAPDRPAPEVGSLDDIGARIQSGVAWKAVSQVLLQMSRMLVAILVAHLLTPHEWGVAAMVMVVVGFTVAFTDNALGTALVQRPNLTEEDKSTVLWFNIVLGILLMGAGIALAGPIADFYHEPSVRPLFVAASIGLFVSCLGSTHAALMVRGMDFRPLELRQIIATLAGGVVGVVVALMHFGAWAIVGQQLAVAAVSTALLWGFLRWRPRMTFSLESLRGMGRFAGVLFGENLVYQGGTSFFNVLIGRVLGAAALGAFGLASNIIFVPAAKVAAPVAQVFFPAFSRMSGDRKQLTDVCVRSTRLVLAVTFPALAGLAILASDFVPVILGPRWSDAIILLQLGAVAAIAKTLDPMMSEILLALNKPGALFRLTVLSLVANIVALLVGLPWGIVGVMAAYAVVAWICVWVRVFVVVRSLDLSIGRFLSAFSGIVKAIAVMVLVLVACREALIAADVAPVWRLAALTILGAAVYVWSCLRFSGEIRFELRRVVERRRNAVSRQTYVPRAEAQT